jgi:hypothetical protein
MHNNQYVKGLNDRKNVYKMFVVPFGIAIVFLLVINAIQGKVISRLQGENSALEREITALEAAVQESMIYVPDGNSGYKEFEIIKRF